LVAACVEKFSAKRREGIQALFEHFKPAVVAYDEVCGCIFELALDLHGIMSPGDR